MLLNHPLHRTQGTQLQSAARGHPFLGALFSQRSLSGTSFEWKTGAADVALVRVHPSCSETIPAPSISPDPSERIDGPYSWEQGRGACWGSRIVARGAGPQRPSAGGAGQAAARGLGRLPAEHLLGPRVRTLSLNGHGHPRLRPPPAAPMIRPAGRLALRQAAGHRAGLTPGVLRVDLHRTRPRCDGLLSALAPVPSGLEASSVQGRLRGQRLRFSFTLKTENSTCKRET